MRNKNTKTKTRVIRASKTIRKYVSSVQSDGILKRYILSIQGVICSYNKTIRQTLLSYANFLDSKHIAFQKNISSIKQQPDISFDYVNSSVS